MEEWAMSDTIELLMGSVSALVDEQDEP